MSSTFTHTVERLKEIREEIEELNHEALQLVRNAAPASVETAKAYWNAQITMALSDEHEYIGGGSYTLSDSIQAIETGEDEE